MYEGIYRFEEPSLLVIMQSRSSFKTDSSLAIEAIRVLTQNYSKIGNFPGLGNNLSSFMTHTVFERTQGVWCVQTYTGEDFFLTSNINASVLTVEPKSAPKTSQKLPHAPISKKRQKPTLLTSNTDDSDKTDKNRRLLQAKPMKPTKTEKTDASYIVSVGLSQHGEPFHKLNEPETGS